MTKRLSVLTGVVGDPVKHSKSPLIHNFWIKRYRLEGIYAPFEVCSKDLALFFKLAPDIGLRGLNVTTPHKQEAIKICTQLSDRAKRVGAVNTITFAENGDVLGDITDGWGFLANLKQTAGWHPLGKRVLLLGAGAAASAIIDTLIEEGIHSITLANRTPAKAAAIRQKSKGTVIVGAWPPAPNDWRDADLIINGTTIGMLDRTNADIPWKNLPNLTSKLATDLIYKPLETSFLNAAAAAGATTVDGLGMLLHQARPGFKIWHGIEPNVDDLLRDRVLTKTGYLP